jgi:NAD(P)-dependent dehydrogenase (short-subunit alcohol dehydrogenase family)
MPQTIFITGASSGIGRATTRHFAQQGWNIVATMRNPDDGADLADLPGVVVDRLDLLEPDSIRRAVAAAEERFDGIDVLVNNAGYGAFGLLEATPIEVIRRQFDVNVFGLIETIQAALPGMRTGRRGTIVNVSSVGGRAAYPLGTPYHGSKWAVEGFTEALHFELLPFGIRTKIIEPGGVRTDFSGRSVVFTTDPALTDYEPFLEARKNAGGTPTGVMEPEEVAEVIWTAVTDGTDQLRYLAGDGARTVLGQRYSPEHDEAFVAAMRTRFGL